MPNFKGQYDELSLIKVQDCPVVPNTITPETRIITCQSLTLSYRFWRLRQALQACHDPSSYRLIKLLKVFEKIWVIT